MQKIYTKTGDRGDTGLFGGERVSKDAPRICAYGDIDELNALIGWIRGRIQEEARGTSPTVKPVLTIDPWLQKIQNDLFDMGALLATPHPERLKTKASRFLSEEDIAFLETSIDQMEEELPPLNNFILPGGTELASRAHMARTVCRRAERNIVSLMKVETLEKEVLVYTNRLSDFLFVLARWLNRREGGSETLWEKK